MDNSNGYECGGVLTLYYIPLEPLEERYTKQWYFWFQQEFQKHFDTVTIDGESLTDKVEVGAFLDVNSSHYYRFSQFQKIIKLFYERKIKNGDIFFLSDLEFPGHGECLRYLADLQNIKVKIFGFLHAGSYTREDFVSKCEPYAKYFEVGWLKMCDGVFVGSNYHKNALLNRRVRKLADFDDCSEIRNKVVVTGNPWRSNEIRNMVGLTDKTDQIIFPNRFDYEKRPNIFLDLCHIIKREFNIPIVITTSRPFFRSTSKWLEKYAQICEGEGLVQIKPGLSKTEYYKILASSRVMISTTIEENFGYCTLEALTFNTYPLHPNDYAGPELVENDRRFLYNSYDELLDKLPTLLKLRDDVSYMAKKYDSSIDKMVEVIKKT